MKYFIDVEVKRACGTQIWEIEADSPEDALAKFQEGGGDIIQEELEVLSLEEVALDSVREAGEGNQQQMIDSKVQHSHIATVLVPGGLSLETCWWSQWKVANCTALVSETAGELAKETGVGCCWFEKPDGMKVYSLRAEKESNVDVSVLASAFGGGGHAKAAAFEAASHPWLSRE